MNKSNTPHNNPEYATDPQAGRRVLGIAALILCTALLIAALFLLALAAGGTFAARI